MSIKQDVENKREGDCPNLFAWLHLEIWCLRFRFVSLLTFINATSPPRGKPKFFVSVKVLNAIFEETPRDSKYNKSCWKFIGAFAYYAIPFGTMNHGNKSGGGCQWFFQFFLASMFFSRGTYNPPYVGGDHSINHRWKIYFELPNRVHWASFIWFQ